MKLGLRGEAEDMGPWCQREVERSGELCRHMVALVSGGPWSPQGGGVLTMQRQRG